MEEFQTILSAPSLTTLILRHMEANRAHIQRRLKGWEAILSLWLTNVLVIVQQICGAQRDSGLYIWLDKALGRLAHCVMGIVLLHTSVRVTLRTPRKCWDPRRLRGALHLRGFFGAELRRAFKAKTLAERAAKIRAALDNLDALIARMVRRLKKGLSRSAYAFTRVAIGGAVALIPMLRGFAIRGADTS